MSRLLVLTLACSASFAFADEPKTTTDKASTSSSKSDEITMSSHIGNLVGQVVKSGSDSITIKVSEVVVTGITRKHVGGGSGSRGHSVSVPKYGTKMVELTYPVSGKVVVKTVSGKEADLSSVWEGENVVIHLDKVKQGKLGEKLESHVEVKRIDVPNATAAKK